METSSLDVPYRLESGKQAQEIKGIGGQMAERVRAVRLQYQCCKVVAHAPRVNIVRFKNTSIMDVQSERSTKTMQRIEPSLRLARFTEWDRHSPMAWSLEEPEGGFRPMLDAMFPIHNFRP
jgi:hypothetical protein